MEGSAQHSHADFQRVQDEADRAAQGTQSTQFGKDNPSAPTHWATGLSTESCIGVDKLLAAARGFPKRQIPYAPGTGPNSNTAAHYLGGVAGFTPTVPPPGSWGWSVPMLPYYPDVPYRP